MQLLSSFSWVLEFKPFAIFVALLLDVKPLKGLPEVPTAK